ncbi:hypothetical protein BKA69DRAFT_911651 [Paraphysoderma sedebokerense]|nr:hypothetical protein BKA69DRAFT_911651 [Paraphysoderma sedebokerense]
MGQFTSQSRSIEAVLSRLQQLETIVNDYHTAIPSVSSEPDSAAPANDGTAKICSVVEIPSGQRHSYFENRTAFDSKSINLTADPKTEDKKKICKPFTLVSIKNHRGFGSKTADQHTKTEKSVILALQSTNRKKSTESAIIDKANDSSSATLLSPPPMAVNSVLPSKVVRGTTYLHNHQPTAPSTSNNLGESKSTVQLSNQTIEEYSCSPLPWEIDSPPKVETPRKVDSAIQPVIPPNSKVRHSNLCPQFMSPMTETGYTKSETSAYRGSGR